MTLPALTVQRQGQGVIGADDFNSKIFWATNVANLRAFTGLGGMAVWMEGTTTADDGGQGMFFYDPSATAADDNGATTIQPTGVTGSGRWIRQQLTAASLAPNSINLPQIQQIPALTLLGNNMGVAGNVTALTVAQVLTLLGISGGGSGGGIIPSGGIALWPTSTAPAGWLLCNGAAVSRTTFANLNSLANGVGYAAPFGVGDGSTTFNVPDFRGYFPRGWDSSGAVDPGRTFGSLQQSALEAHKHITDTPTVFVSPGYTDPFGSSTVSVSRVGFSTAGTGSTKLGLSNDAQTYSGFNPNTPGVVSPTETRPTNVALSFIIKT